MLITRKSDLVCILPFTNSNRDYWYIGIKYFKLFTIIFFNYDNNSITFYSDKIKITKYYTQLDKVILLQRQINILMIIIVIICFGMITLVIIINKILS